MVIERSYREEFVVCRNVTEKDGEWLFVSLPFKTVDEAMRHASRLRAENGLSDYFIAVKRTESEIDSL